MLDDELKTCKDESFKKQLAPFYPIAKAEIEKVEQEVKDMAKGFDDLALYFGEEPGVDVTTVVYEFVPQFVGAVQDNSKAKEVAKRAAEKKMQAAKMTKRKGLVEKGSTKV